MAGHLDRTMDKDATIRSSRSNRSNRSLQSAMPGVHKPYRVQGAKIIHSHPSPQHPPPPPYQAAATHSPDLCSSRREVSPSGHSLESGKWDDVGRNARWSVWTADTTLNFSDGDDYNDEDHAKSSGSGASGIRSGTNPSTSVSNRYMHYASAAAHEEDEAGPSSSYSSRSSTPPSPTTEAALDAALSSTMLALTTANSLLLSTMSSRRELARLRAMEAALDQEMLRKEADIRRKIESNRQMTRWMERACRRLDDVIEGRDGQGSMDAEELNELTSFNPTAKTPFTAPGSMFIARNNHTRAPSTAVADSREVPIPFGIVEAKDTNATVGKSAAKRLERMLQRSSQSLQNTATDTAPSDSHSRTSSNATSVSGSEAAGLNAAATSTLLSAPARPSRLRQTSDSNALHLRLSVGRSATALPTTASSAPPNAHISDNGTAAISDQSLRRLGGTTSRQSVRADSEYSAVPSDSARGDANDEGSSASRLLSTFISASSRPTSRLSDYNVGAADTLQSPQPLQSQADLTSAKDPSQLLTPPMPGRELADSLDVSVVQTPSGSLRRRPSISASRSPSALRMEGHVRRGTGSSVTDEALGVVASMAASSEQRTSRKGALEALRKLNSGEQGGAGSNGTTSTSAGASASSLSADAASARGWGGTLASWMGIGNGGTEQGGADTTDSVNASSLTTSTASFSG